VFPSAEHRLDVFLGSIFQGTGRDASWVSVSAGGVSAEDALDGQNRSDALDGTLREKRARQVSAGRKSVRALASALWSGQGAAEAGDIESERFRAPH
jgi:hypothetical protein